MTREDGFYWVRFNGEVFIARWSEDFYGMGPCWVTDEGHFGEAEVLTERLRPPEKGETPLEYASNALFEAAGKAGYELRVNFTRPRARGKKKR